MIFTGHFLNIKLLSNHENVNEIFWFINTIYDFLFWLAIALVSGVYQVDISLHFMIYFTINTKKIKVCLPNGCKQQR